MPIKLQIRRGTASAWSSASPAPVLLQGEIGYETDTGNFKVGDGTTAWASLPYTLPHKTGTPVNTPSIVSIDQTNSRLGIGTTTPLSQVHVESASPVIRLKDTDAGTAHILLDANNVEGSLTISADPSNAAGSTKINLATDGTTRATIDENGRLGVGTTAPTAALHISTSSPIVRLTDTDDASTYSQISQDNTQGSLSISADEGNTAASTVINLRTDGTNRVIVASSAVQIIPQVILTGGISGTVITTANLINGSVTRDKIFSDVGFHIVEERLVSSTTWTVPTGVYRIQVLIVGGGGGCRIANGDYVGGWPACVLTEFDVVPAASCSVTIGTGGISQATPTAGGNTTFGGLTAPGGLANTSNLRPAIPALTYSAVTNFTRLTAREIVGNQNSMGYWVRGYATTVWNATSGPSVVSPVAYSFTTDNFVTWNANPLVTQLPGIGAAASHSFVNGTPDLYTYGPAVGGAVVVRYLQKS